jgi:hypothetical protein
MRPDLSNAIVTQRRTQSGIPYFEILECDKKMDSEVLSWFIVWALNNNKNLYYQINRGYNKIGSKDFLESNL